MRTSRNAFTLIELLIVVAIIAILAAIATPNFLEAQTRSKVARVRTDLRSVATAMECYRVDNNRYPTCDVTLNGMPALSTVTTPIAYIVGSGMRDPFFGKTEGVEFKFYNYMARDESALVLNGTGRITLWWMLASNGPDGVLQDFAAPLLADDTVGFMNTCYDPTNAIVSDGNLYRLGGQVQGMGSQGAFFVDTATANSAY